MTEHQCRAHPKALMGGVDCPDCTQAREMLSLVEKTWDRFIERCAVDTLGEAAVITEGKRQRNFLGSVDAYKKVFMAVAREHMNQEGE